MASPRLQQLKIDTVDVSTYLITWKVARELNNRISSAQIKVHIGIKNVIDFDTDNAQHEVEIYRGISTGNETIIFKGEVTAFVVSGSYILLSCNCELAKAITSEVTKSFDRNIDVEAGVISEIALTLITDYAGLSADSGTVQNSGTINIVNKFLCNHASVFERLEKLSDLLDWQFYYNPITGKVYFEPIGNAYAAVILTVGSNVTNIPQWKYDKSKLINSYTIIGGEELVEKEELFNGTGAKTDFALVNTPVGVRVEVGGTLKVGGNDTTSTSFDYSVDIPNKTIIFSAGSIPGAGAGNVKIIYTHSLPRPVISTDSVSIERYKLREKTSFIAELKNIDDVVSYNKKYIEIYAYPFVSSKLSVIAVDDLFPGQKIRVVDTINGVDAFFLVGKVEFVFPYQGDVVYVGDENIRIKNIGSSVSNRVRRLEEETGKNQDKLLHVIPERHSVKVNRVSLYILKRAINDSFIVDSQNIINAGAGVVKTGARRNTYTMEYRGVY